MDENSEEHVLEVSGGQTLTNEDLSDGILVADSEIPTTYKRSVKSLMEQVKILQQNVEDLESSLVIKVSSLKEIVSEKEKEYAVHLDRLEDCKQKEEEAKRKLHWLVQENKSETIQLSQYDKMIKVISQLQDEIISLSDEKKSKDEKIQKLKDEFNMLSKSLSKSEEELESLKIKVRTENEAREKIMDENTTLQSQLQDRKILVQDLKSQLTTVHKELSDKYFEDLKFQLANARKELSEMQNAKLKIKLNENNSVSDISKSQEEFPDDGKIEEQSANLGCVSPKRSLTNCFVLGLLLLLCFLLLSHFHEVLNIDY